MTLLPFSSTPSSSIYFPLLPMKPCNISTIQRTEEWREVDVYGGAVPSLGSGSGTSVSRKCRGCCQGAGGWKMMVEAQSWQTFKSLFIAAQEQKGSIFISCRKHNFA